jgi:hypothetical protein
MSSDTVSASFSQEPTRRRKVLLVLLAAVAVVGLSIWCLVKAQHHRSAILRWQPQLLEMEQGENIAERHNYPNPPLMGLLLLPIAKLPPLGAALAWFYLKVGLTILALWWIFRIVATKEQPFPRGALAFAVLLSLRPIVGDLQHGNVNLFILFLVAGCLAAYTAKRDVLAGLTLAVAIACKVTPALFVPYFLWKRAWRLLAGCTAGLFLFLWPGVVPSVVLGWQEHREQLTSWYHVMVRPYVVEGKVTSEHNNQSLPGLAARMLTHSPSFSTYVDDVYTPTDYDNVAELPPVVVRGLCQACFVLFAVLVLWTCRTPGDVRGGWRLAAEYSLVVLGMLLFSERTWKHHCVTLALPMAVLCYCAAVVVPGRMQKRVLTACLAAAFLLISSTSTGALPQAVAKHAQVYGAYVWAFLVLIGALVMVLRQPTMVGWTTADFRTWAERLKKADADRQRAAIEEPNIPQEEQPSEQPAPLASEPR